MGAATYTQPVPVRVFPGDTGAGTHAAVVLTYPAAGVGQAHLLDALYWSYGAAPTGGNLQVADGGNVVLSVDVTAAGPGFLPFDRPLRGTPNQALTVTLADGGAAVAGKVTALHRTAVVADPASGGGGGLDFSLPANSGLLPLFA